MQAHIWKMQILNHCTISFRFLNEALLSRRLLQRITILVKLRTMKTYIKDTPEACGRRTTLVLPPMVSRMLESRPVVVLASVFGEYLMNSSELRTMHNDTFCWCSWKIWSHTCGQLCGSHDWAKHQLTKSCACLARTHQPLVLFQISKRGSPPRESWHGQRQGASNVPTNT